MKIKSIPHKLSVVFIGLLLIVILEAVYLFSDELITLKNQFLQAQRPEVNLEQLSQEILDKCQSASYRPSCYDQEIPKVMGVPYFLSMEEAFAVTKIVQTKDREFAYCHVLGHKLSAEEVKKNPNSWKEVVSRCPSGVCSNGCIHGGFQEKFRAEHLTDSQIESVLPDLKTICEPRANWSPTGLEQGSCYHAVGHLTMYLTQADLPKSIILCDRITTEGWRQLCYDGVFMQIFQPLEPEDFALIKGKEPAKDQIVDYCTPYSSQAKTSCLSESWPLFRTELQIPENIISFCGMQENRYVPRCYSALFYVLATQFNLDQLKMQQYCLALTGSVQAQCFANFASRLIETDYRNIQPALALCQSAPDGSSKDSCHQELAFYASYNFKANSQEFYHLCQALPSPWNTRCLNKQAQPALKTSLK